MFRSVFIASVLFLGLFAHMNVQAHANSASQQCLALAMYWEARGEGKKGMNAVGSVVMNRVKDQRFPNTVCRVVKQGGELPPCQFSWWCDGKSDRPTDSRSWRRAMHLAEQVLHGHQHDPTRGALYFHSRHVKPRWKLQRVARIGAHIFYR